jgi:hypothetical protein
MIPKPPFLQRLLLIATFHELNASPYSSPGLTTRQPSGGYALHVPCKLCVNFWLMKRAITICDCTFSLFDVFDTMYQLLTIQSISDIVP